MGRGAPGATALSGKLARLQESSRSRPSAGAGARAVKVKGCAPVKKVLLLALIAVGILAVWRKVQSDRAELDLWTEATTDDD
jgi:hypothetical protein